VPHVVSTSSASLTIEALGQGDLHIMTITATSLSPLPFQRWSQQSKKQDPQHALDTSETIVQDMPRNENIASTPPSTANATYGST